MKSKRINQREIEKFILNELPNRRMREIKNQLRENTELREEVKRIESSNKSILMRYPPSQTVENIFDGLSHEIKKEKKEIKTRTIFIRRLLYVSPLFVLALLVIFINVDFFRGKINKSVNKNFDQTTRSKGLNHAYLIVYKSRQGKIEQLKNCGKAKAGDTLQLVYSSPKESYGVIFSIDGRGDVTLHFPNGLGLSTALKRNRKVKLPTGFLLDDAPDFERFFFLTSDSEIDVRFILNQAKKQAKNLSQIKKGDVSIDKNLNQYSIIIKKGENP